MQLSKARAPIAAAAVCMLACGACIFAFLPPFVSSTTSSVPLVLLFGLGIAVTVVLHIVFLAIAARRLQRPALWWVVVAVLTFPVGSIVGLVLFEWFSDPRDQSLAPTQA